MSKEFKPSIRLFVGPEVIQEIVKYAVEILGRGSFNNLPSDFIYYSNGYSDANHGIVKRGSKLFYSPLPGIEWAINEAGIASATLFPEDYIRLSKANSHFPWKLIYSTELVNLPPEMLGDNFQSTRMLVSPGHGRDTREFKFELIPTDDFPGRCIVTAANPWVLARGLSTIGVTSCLLAHFGIPRE